MCSLCVSVCARVFCFSCGLFCVTQVSQQEVRKRAFVGGKKKRKNQIRCLLRSAQTPASVTEEICSPAFTGCHICLLFGKSDTCSKAFRSQLGGGGGDWGGVAPAALFYDQLKKEEYFLEESWKFKYVLIFEHLKQKQTSIDSKCLREVGGGGGLVGL